MGFTTQRFARARSPLASTSDPSRRRSVEHLPVHRALVLPLPRERLAVPAHGDVPRDGRRVLLYGLLPQTNGREQHSVPGLPRANAATHAADTALADPGLV